ncbi:MAG: Eco57I restriction-modification methylase domain-containing protein [Bacteroidota bacterium]|nr:Eco57I restriction-modification methylase domain-containing protein [Bacteroidota bacterium]
MSRERLQTIIEKFNPEDFIHFFREKSREFKPTKDELEVRNAIDFSDCKYIGEIVFSNEDKLIVYLLKTNKSLSERSGKKSQYEEGKRILKETNSDAGIFIFYDEEGNFRFSLIYTNYSGKKRDFSTFKRFTYFVSKEFTNKTFLQRIGDGDFSSLEKIKEAFSVEKVNKEFYREIAIMFSKLVGGERKVKSKIEKFKPLLKLPGIDNHLKLQEFAVRMIGRIVFCWFLKKKLSKEGNSLIPENILSKDAVTGNKNYYHSVLEKLFFEILNTKQEDRKKFTGYELYKNIPFLNGGLFEPHDDDLYKPSLLNSLIVPDKWFTEFFEILESYNFTIDENTSIDVELSIDPEMLGRIFENLLAEINPETGETARKSTGSYYTPRPIVDYMVDESLKQYLITKTNINEDKLEPLLSYNSDENEITDSEAVKIIDALDEIKILDPACGSGAFPIGILQKMLLILQKIDNNSEKWLEKKLKKIDNSLLRREMKSKFKNDNLDYIRKLGLIQDSIYGVDIQSIAVEISKLRCFLTLIVDESIDDKKENRGIIPLPNLEFKFVAANTLISLPEDEGSLFDESDFVNKLEELRDEYFTSSSKRKSEIENEFLETQEKMARQLAQNKITKGRALELANWNPFSYESAKWFDPKWMFGLKEGFDIVIGNPPYVRVDDIESEHKVKYKKIFQTCTGKYDLYYLFFEKSTKVKSAKGVIAFITPNKYCAATSGETLRSIILDNKNSIEILSTSKLIVFKDAANYPLITLIKSCGLPGEIFVREANSIDQLQESTESNYHLKIDKIRELPSYIIPINVSQQKIEIAFSLLKGNVPLGKYVSFSEGLRIPAKCELQYKSKETLRIVKQYQFDKWSPIKEGTFISKRDFSNVITKTSDRYQKIVNKKILIAEDALEITATIDTEYHIPQGGIYFGSPNKKYLTQINTLLSVINSTLLSKIYEILFGGMHMGGGYLRYRTNFLENLPIDRKIFETTRLSVLADHILLLKKQNKDTTALEQQLDVMVYKLYELTYKEVKVVDPEFWMSEEEYERQPHPALTGREGL